MKIRLQSFTGGITLVDLAIVFAVVTVVGAPSVAKGLFVAALCALFLVVALTVLAVVRAVGLLFRLVRGQATP